MKKSAFFCNDPATIDYVFAQGRRDKVASISALYPAVVTTRSFEEHAAALRGVEAVFSTWGMLNLTPPQLARLPALKAVFYAAGSVRDFAPALLARDILVMSAWAANAISVAEFTVGQIVLANKGYFRNARAAARPETRPQAVPGKGNFGETVALLGAGQIGRAVISLLRTYVLRVIVWDPFLSAADATALGVEKVETLDEAFRRGLVVSNHLANLPATRGLLRAEHFSAMRPNATFINTARGAILVGADLIAVLRQRPDLSALLDVTDPEEPPAPDSPLYALPNVHLTSHIAGATGDEVARMADYAIADFLAWEHGQPLRWAVTAEMLKTMA